MRGHFKNVRGHVVFDEEHPTSGSVEAIIDARGIWTGERDRDAHLRSADFLDVERHPEIRFRGRGGRALGDGARALEMPGSGCRPGIILLDIVMPVMDGIRFQAPLKSAGACNSLSLLTALPFELHVAWRGDGASHEL